LVAAAKFLVAATKKLFFVPNFVAETKPFFFRERIGGNQIIVLVSLQFFHTEAKKILAFTGSCSLFDGMQHRMQNAPKQSK